MKAKYIESCEAGFVTVRGVRFPEGRFVNIDDDELFAKLAGNSHFTTEPESVEALEELRAEEAAQTESTEDTPTE